MKKFIKHTAAYLLLAITVPLFLLGLLILWVTSELSHLVCKLLEVKE